MKKQLFLKVKPHHKITFKSADENVWSHPNDQNLNMCCDAQQTHMTKDLVQESS
jgi:hypothetical protein